MTAHFHSAIIFVTVLLLNCNFNLSEDCSLNFANDFPDKEPVLLKQVNGEYELIEPSNDSVVIATADEILVACSGSKNNLTEVGQASAHAECVSGQTLTIAGKQYLFSELACNKTITGEFQETSTACGGGRGVLKHIGYNVDNQWYTLFDVCYDNDNGESLYTEHTLYGSAIDNAKVVNSRPGFKVGGLGPGVAADNAYKQTTQKATFTTLLGSAALAEKYIHVNSYLARGHLSPDGDFVFVTSQFSSYFYINTVPQWQAINNGNWKSLEFAIRDAAAVLSSNIQVITGGHEVLSYPNTSGEDTKIYLVSQSKLPAPKFVWKIFYSPDTQNGIAFVSVNDPFKTNVTEDDYLCNNICEQYNWGSISWQNSERGLLYCCDIDELREVVKTIPALKVSGIQEGNSNSDNAVQ